MANFRDELRDRTGGPSDAELQNPVQYYQLRQQRESERLDKGPERPFYALATLLLAGVGGWAAVRHFPKGRLAGLTGEIRDFFQNPGRFGISDKVLPKLHRALDSVTDVVAQQPWAHVHKDNFGQFLGSSRAATDPEVNRALRILADVAEKNPDNFGHVLSAQRTAATKYLRPIPQDTSGLRSLTLGDLFNPTGGWKTETFGTMPENFQNLHRTIQRFASIPGIRGSSADLLHQVQVDSGVYLRRSSAGAVDLVNLRHLSPSQWIRRIGEKASAARMLPMREQLRTGAVGARLADWAMQLMVPTELFSPGPGLAHVGPEAIRAALPGVARHEVAGGVYLGGQVLPLYRGGLLGQPLEGRYILGRQTSAMGAAGRMRFREMGERRAMERAAHGPLSTSPVGRTAKYLADHKIDPQSFRGLAVRFGDVLGLGPQFSVEEGLQQAQARAKAQGLDWAESALENPESLPKRIWQWTTSPNPIGKMREALKTAANAIPGRKHLEGQYFVARPGQAVSDWGNYLVGRVGRLLEETTRNVTGTAVGIRPGLTPLGSLGRWVGVGAAAWAGFKGLQYVDYHTRNLIGTGPLTLPVQAYTQLRVAQQAAFAGLGIQQSADYLENLAPGLVNSPLSRVARAAAVTRMASGIAPFGGTFGAGLASRINLPGRFGRLGTAAAVGLGLTQLTDIGQSPANLAAVYRGDVDVPVREARWWAMGTQPYTGGRILYTRPHLIASYLSRAETIGRYGSEAEAWKNSLFPTVESWGGLRPLLDPYRVERQNYLKRPYPLTAPMFEEVPFVGPALAATVGALIKPVQRWHGAYWQGNQLQEGYPQLAPAGAAEALGYPSLSGLPRRTAGDPTRPIEVLGKQIDVIRDFLGMPGFLLGAIKKQFTGEDDFNVANRQIATAGRITSAERQYYDWQMGGGLGMTELFRRFLPHRKRQVELVNPIPNLAPNWLPGSFSAFAQDRPARVDLHRGDPYATIPQGELRLPGLGYEALHRLHSGIPGVYDAYDRWKILRDVAPTSQAFRHYDAIVRGWAAGSAFSNKSGGKWMEESYGRLRGVVRAAVDGDTITVDVNGRLVNVRIAGGNAPEVAHTRFEASFPESLAGAIARQRLENHAIGRSVEIAVTGINPGDTKYSQRLVGRVVTGGWGGRDISTELEAAHPAYNLTPGQQARVWSTRQDLERRFQPYPFTERIFQDPTASVPRNMRDLTTRSLTGINTAINREGEFSLPEKLIGRAWESVSHLTLPGPLNWPVNKLFAQRDPLEVYRMQTQGGLEFADWASPVQSYVRPWMHQTVGALANVAGMGYIQPRLQRQRVAEQSMDMLEYARARTLGRRAWSMDQPGLAAYYQERQARTVTGALETGNLRFIRGALPRTERGYFTAFQREADPGRRRQILSLVPENVGTVLRRAWGQDVTQERQAQLALVQDLMHSIPRNWAGYHPEVPMTAMKVKVAQREGWDIHDFGFAHRDEYLAEDLFSEYLPTPVPEMTFTPDLRPGAFDVSSQLGLEGVSITSEDHPGPPEIQVRLRRDRRKFYAEYERHESGMRF